MGTENSCTHWTEKGVFHIFLYIAWWSKHCGLLNKNEMKKSHIFVTSSTLLLNQIDWTNKTSLGECSVHELWGESHCFLWLSFCEGSDTCWQLVELNSGTLHMVFNLILNNICIYTHTCVQLYIALNKPALWITHDK